MNESINNPEKKAHAVVIGSGFGGLAAAIRLGARGYKVTVLERLDKAGGRAYVEERDGYIFDRGPTIVTAPFVFEELWALCGRKVSDDVKLVPMDPFYQIRFDDGRVFSYSGDHDAMRAEVAKFNPDDVEAYDRFVKLSGDIYKTAFEELAAQPFHSLLFTLSTAPDLLRLGGHRTVYKSYLHTQSRSSLGIS